MSRSLSLLALSLLVPAGTLLASPHGSAAAPAAEPASPPSVLPGGLPAHDPSMLVTPRELQALLRDGEVVLLHVSKTMKGYREGHIPGALFLPWKAVAVSKGLANELPSIHRRRATAHRLGIEPGTRVVLYDEEKGIQAARAFFALDSIGLAGGAALLDGQLPAWKAAGLPLSQEVTPLPEHHAHRDGAPRRNTVSLKEVQRLVVRRDRPFRLVDARPEAQYSGAEAGEGIQRAGHIPCAENVPVDAMLESVELPRLRDPDSLRDLLGITPENVEHRWVPYCRTGARASLTYFVMRYLGLQPRMYDGSFSQWSGASGEDYPLCTAEPVCAREGHLHGEREVVQEE